MSPTAAFLITPADASNDNHLRLPALFTAAGWQVYQAPHDNLRLEDDEIYAGDRAAAEFDLIWPVGLGPRHTFLDRQQLLTRLPQDKLINPADAYLSLHGKTAWLGYAPPTAVSTQAQRLMDVCTAHGGDWVLKPVAGSFGRDVHRIAAAQEIATHMQSAPTRYWMLQRFIPEIAGGETRTLICREQIVGSYLRVPTRDMRANLAAHGVARKVELSAPERALVQRVHAELMTHEIGFAAIDTVGGYLMEVNLANPGGLQTLTELYGNDAGVRLMDAINGRYDGSARSAR